MRTANRCAVALAVVLLACGAKSTGSTVTAEGGPDASVTTDAGPEGSWEADSNDGSGDDGSAVADAEQRGDGSSDGGITCTQPVQQGGSSGGGGVSVGWTESCSNGHSYRTICNYPYCDCECTDVGPQPDGGVNFTSVQACGGYGFAACGFPCFPGDGGYGPCAIGYPCSPDSGQCVTPEGGP